MGERHPAAAGFLLSLCVGAGLVSRHLAVEQAQRYLQRRYAVEWELPLRRVRLLPAGAAEVRVDPWTQAILGWQAEL